ncbi:MAG: hypothetical protein ACYCQJ_02700 [Nitrososphaerales archaeon]
MTAYSDTDIITWLRQIEAKKPRIRIGIYGAYYPQQDHELLYQLRDKLRSYGYEQTYLVENIQDNPGFLGDSFLKSQFSLEMSNVNLFVATLNGAAQGYTRELDYVIKSPALIFKSILLVETQYDVFTAKTHKALSSMLKTDIAGINFKVSEWTKGNLEELVDAAKGPINDLFYWYIRNRPSDIP